MALVQSGLSLGKTLFAITIVEASSGQPVPGASVIVKSWRQSEESEIRAIALNTPTSLDRYDAVVDFDAPGTWHVSVEVDSDIGRVSVEMAQLEVPKTRSITGGTYVFMGVFAVLIMILAVCFLLQKIVLITNPLIGSKCNQTFSMAL